MPDKIIVLGPKSYGDPLRDLGEIDYGMNGLFEDPSQVKLVMFTGGEDVHPSFYDGVDCGISFTNLHRDMYEQEIFKTCRQHNIKMTGICRGFQFLNVMCGGRMYQHFLGHAIFGRHPAYFAYNERTAPVSSTHHQLVELGPEATALVWAPEKLSKYYINADGNSISNVEREIEAAVFPRFNAFGVQFHPEMMAEHEPGRVFYQEMVSDFLQLEVKNFREKYGEKEDERRSDEQPAGRGATAGG